MTHHLVVEGPVRAIEQLADEVGALDAAALHVRQAVAYRGLAPNVQVAQLQQQLPADGQRPVIPPHRNLQAAQRSRLGTSDEVERLKELRPMCSRPCLAAGWCQLSSSGWPLHAQCPLNAPAQRPVCEGSQPVNYGLPRRQQRYDIF